MIMLQKTHLTAMLKQETLLKNVCAEKERMIHFLLEQNKRLQSRIDRLELRLLPPMPKEKPTAPIAEAGEVGWQSYLNKQIKEIEEEEKNGISNERRQAGVHESGSGAEARQDVGTIAAHSN
jgi:hypothetical protein